MLINDSVLRVNLFRQLEVADILTLRVDEFGYLVPSHKENLETYAKYNVYKIQLVNDSTTTKTSFHKSKIKPHQNIFETHKE